jgi:hypothetical protein
MQAGSPRMHPPQGHFTPHGANKLIGWIDGLMGLDQFDLTN